MRILFALTYYRPHVSGLTIYVQRLAEALVARGHHVTVLTSRYNAMLAPHEVLNGVHVVRVPVAFWVSKGAIMPGYVRTALPLLRTHDVVAIHLPNTPVEATLLPLLARYVVRRPITATYHCDVQLPTGLFNRLVDEVVFAGNVVAATLVDRLVAYTDDYANHSRLLRRFSHKRVVIPPPVVVAETTPERVMAFRQKHAPNGERLIGFAARFATEKGVEYMLAALPLIQAEVPDVRVLFAGEYQNVIGEEKYWQRLQPLLRAAGERWRFLGVLTPEEMATFYTACDVTVLPSINSTESFGLVQVESMLCGTPVVASDLPGVRVPVQTTGMGCIVPPRNAEALAEAVVDVLRRRSEYVRPREEIERIFSLDRTVEQYESLFAQLAQGSGVRREVGRLGSAFSSNGRVPARRDYLRDHLREVPAFRALIRGIECRLFEAAGPLEPPVLDLGCGDGHFAATAFQEPLLVGLDLQEALVREARERGAYRYPLVASATHLPVADDTFGTVIANCVVEHIPDIEAVLSEVARVLRPGGRFLFGVPSHRFADMLLGSTLLRRLGVKRLAHAYGEWFNRHSLHFHTDHPDVWFQRLSRHGFVVDGWEYYMTPEGLRAFDLAHYVGVPRLISRKLTGKWVAFPNPLATWLFDRWLRPFYEHPTPDGEGPFIFFRARKRG
ncbi:MAG: glycosyltransferase [Ardenticatenia bacterium]|nr:glycosyltransferase [Ardenticatenia bacterium]